MSLDRTPGALRQHEEWGVELLLFLVLMLGVGLGSAAAAWATRRPEIVAVVGDREVRLVGDPTPEQVELFRERWHRWVSTDPDRELPAGLMPLDRS
jgi:hypothetical protein